MFFIIVGFFLFSNGVFAQSLGRGHCSAPSTEKSVDQKKLSGEWYLVEISKPDLQDLFVKCVSVNVSDPNEHGISRTVTSFVSKINGRRWKVRGNIMPDRKACGQQKEDCPKFTAQALGIHSPGWVLGTDYDSFIVGWSCRSIGIAHISATAVYTREQHPDQSVLDKAAAVLAKSNLKNVSLVKTGQDC